MKFTLKRFLPFLYRTRFHVMPEHEVELAFTHEGVEYFQFVNGFDAYCERYAAAQDAINTLSMRVDGEYLDLHTSLTDEYINAGKLSLLSVLNHNLKERRKHISNTELFLQLAAVWYFDKTENAYVFNPEYGEKKIAIWRKDKELLHFFLSGHLKVFMPLDPSFFGNIPTYTKGQNLQELAALKYHLSIISEKSSNKELISTLQSKILLLESLLTQLE